MRVLRWLGEGLLVAGFAAGAFALPWGWVILFPPPGPYTAPLRPRILARKPELRPVDAGAGRLLRTPRSRAPTPVPGEKHLLVDVRARPQTITAYDGVNPVMRFGPAPGSPPIALSGRWRIHARARTVPWPTGEALRWWLTLQPLDQPAAPSTREGLLGICAALPDAAPSPRTPAGIRLRPPDAQRLWEWATVGTPVYFYKHRSQGRHWPDLIQRAEALAAQ